MNLEFVSHNFFPPDLFIRGFGGSEKVSPMVTSLLTALQLWDSGISDLEILFGGGVWFGVLLEIYWWEFGGGEWIVIWYRSQSSCNNRVVQNRNETVKC